MRRRAASGSIAYPPIDDWHIPTAGPTSVTTFRRDIIRVEAYVCMAAQLS